MISKIINNKKILLVRLIIITFLIINISMGRTIADVGSFEDYDFDSGWDSSSSWDSGSSWDWDSGSSYDSDYSYSSGGSSANIIGISDFKIFIIIFIIVIVINVFKNKHKDRERNNELISRLYSKPTVEYKDEAVLAKIRRIDPEFSRNEFDGFAKELFIKLQNAWTERDWEKIRPFESSELFAQHKAQLDGYIKNKQINVIDRICVNDIHLLSFEQIGGKDILKIDLKSRMEDYIIDENTRKVIKGSIGNEYHHVYTLTFMRKTGIKTTLGKTGLNTTNCPNCGAPTTITSSGRCEYCNSVITTEDHGWVLSNLTRRY